MKALSFRTFYPYNGRQGSLRYLSAPRRYTTNRDLERWFRQPKGHERRIHGHRPAGVRIVQEGPTLLLALDAHQAHPDPVGADDLLPYRRAQAARCQREALHRRGIMRKARSTKKRGGLLGELELRYIPDS